jgi:phage terminase large subunit-like protein
METARPAQLAPPESDDWAFWLVLAGRGFGKTRLAMEDAWWYGAIIPSARIALIAATYADARDTMVEGESGLLSLLPEGCLTAWNRSLGELTLYNGSRFKLFASTEPDRLRGPQHHRAYCDELAAWTYPDTWDQMLFGLRLGQSPKVIIATTPKPVPLVKKIVRDKHTVVTRGSTFDNAKNLAPSALEQLRVKYEGSRLGRQELNAEILDDVPGALWTRDMIDAARKSGGLPDMARVVVAVDPSGTRGGSDDGDSIGIVVAGKGVDGRAYVLADRTCKLSPNGWGRRAVEAYREFKADRLVAERNFGGAMVEHVVRTADPNVSYGEVVASRGKVVRAEPIAALYEQGRVSHVGGLSDLEDQMCQIAPDGYLGEGSPDRVDALVWALTELMLGNAGPLKVNSLRM